MKSVAQLPRRGGLPGLPEPEVALRDLRGDHLLGPGGLVKGHEQLQAPVGLAGPSVDPRLLQTQREVAGRTRC